MRCYGDTAFSQSLEQVNNGHVAKDQTDRLGCRHGLVAASFQKLNAID